MSHTYKRGEYELPSVTTIIGDSTDKSGALCQWAANEAVAWIRENNGGVCPLDDLGGAYSPAFCVTESDLDKARFAYKSKSKEALDVGSEVHAAIEHYLKIRMKHPDYPEEQLQADTIEYINTDSGGQAVNAFGAFLQWMDEHEVKPIALEQKVYGDYWAGTLDFKGYIDGKKYITDHKTSKAFYPEMRYQVAAYFFATKNATTDKKDHPEGTGVLRLDKKTGMPEWKDTTKTIDKDYRIFKKMSELYLLRHPIIARRAGYVIK